MAQENKADLIALIQNNLPTNATKYITAALLREVLENMVDSGFNLTDNESYDVNFVKQLASTWLTSLTVGGALEELALSTSKTLAWAEIEVGDIDEGVSKTLTIKRKSDNVTTANYDGIGGSAGDITLNFNDIGTTDYIPYVVLKSEGNAQDNNHLTFVTYGYSTTSVKISIEEIHGAVQNLNLLIEIKKFG